MSSSCVVLGGDFNQLPNTQMWADLVAHFSCVSPKLTTYLSGGIGSALDRLLLRHPMVDNDSARVTYHVRWPVTRPSQHGALWGTLKVASSISPSPGDTVMQVVPTECLIHRGGGAAPDEQYSKLVRRVHAADDLCEFKVAVWTWWREQPLPRQTLPAHCLIRKALKSTQGGNVHVPFATMQSLCEMMSLPVPLSSLRINDQAYLVPRLVAEAILNTYEAGRALASAHPGIVHDTNRIAATPGQARVWDRCRVAAPRVARTSGLVLDKAGRQCRTTAAVDEAMRATRAFWQDEPVVWDAQSEKLLSQYSPPLFAKCTLPVDDDLLRAVVRSPDSAPGLDGLPYAAYRAAPNAASRVLTHRLHDYVGLHAPAPVQALVFIPKADALIRRPTLAIAHGHTLCCCLT